MRNHKCTEAPRRGSNIYLQRRAGPQGPAEGLAVSHCHFIQAPLKIHPAVFHLVHQQELLEVAQLVEQNAEVKVVEVGFAFSCLAFQSQGRVFLVLLISLHLLLGVPDGRQKLGDTQPPDVVVTKGNQVEDGCRVCNTGDEKLNHVGHMPLEEHSFPAVSVTRDVAEAPPLLAASLPVDPIADQISRDTQRKGSGQSLLDKMFLDSC